MRISQHPPSTKNCRSLTIPWARFLCLTSLIWFPLVARPQTTPPAASASQASASIQRDKLRLANNAIEAEWQFNPNGFAATTLTDHFTHRTLSPQSNAFAITLQDGSALKSSEMQVTVPPRLVNLAPDPSSSQLAARFAGWQIEMGLSDYTRQLQVTWRAVLRDGATYVRQEITLHATGKSLPISNVRLVDINIPGARVCGTVKGSPIVARTSSLDSNTHSPKAVRRTAADRANLA